jgi:hypothetical protein
LAVVAVTVGTSTYAKRALAHVDWWRAHGLEDRAREFGRDWEMNLLIVIATNEPIPAYDSLGVSEMWVGGEDEEDD